MISFGVLTCLDRRTYRVKPAGSSPASFLASEVKFTQFDVRGDNTTGTTSADEAAWGGAGVKILLAVDYEREPMEGEPSRDAPVAPGHGF